MIKRSHGEDPDENHLPEPQIPGPVMVASDLRITIEKSLADTKDVDAAKEDDGEENTEDDPQGEHGVAVLPNYG